MKITTQILSIPPYISTSWKNIASLHMEDRASNLILVVTLLSGTRIEVPHLEPAMSDAIFAAHARYLEQDEKATVPKAFPKAPFSLPIINEQMLALEIPLKNGLTDMNGFGTLLQHNNELANTPDLPPDVLEKITLIAKSMGVEDPNAMPKPEPHCNCMRCQIARAMQAGLSDKEEKKGQDQEEIVSDDDLKFCNWKVEQANDKLYIVTNSLDEKEQYNVFLGDPVGCTCGKNHCEHIHAVLSS